MPDPTPQALRKWRESHGLTQAKAAEIAGVRTFTWQRWEYGERRIPQWLDAVMRERWGAGLGDDGNSERLEREEGAVSESYEQQARDPMEKCGWNDAQARSAGEVVVVANRLRDLDRAHAEIATLRDERDALLEAAKELYRCTEEVHDSGPPGEGWQSEDLARALHATEVAIAKVEGDMPKGA